MKKLALDIGMITIGCLGYALALTMLAIPNELAEGGVPGLAIILYYGFGWSPGIVTFILTSIIMLIGFRSLPKRALFLSIITVPMISFFIYITEDLVESLGDPLVSAVFAGFFIGVGSGLIFRTGSSMGGTSIIAMMFSKGLGWDMVRTLFVLDMLIVMSGMFLIGPLHTMYTVITLFIGKKATDLMMEGLDPRKAVSIISPKAPEIADAIIDKMRLSVTVFKGYGGYMKTETEMTYVIITKFQLMHVKNIAASIDENSFVVVHDVRDVSGGSFAWETTGNVQYKRENVID